MTIQEANDSFLKFLRYDKIELLSKSMEEITHPEDWQLEKPLLQHFLLSEENQYKFEKRVADAHGDYLWMRVSSIKEPDPDDGQVFIRLFFQNIDDGKFLNLLENLEKSVLELSAQQAISIQEILEKYLDGIESLHHGMKCSILRLEGNLIFNWSSKSLPKTFMEALEGMDVLENPGLFGAVVKQKTELIVPCIADDPNWGDLSETALANELHACWAIPILDKQKKVLVILTVFFHRAKNPNMKEKKTLARACHLLSVILENRKYVEQLAESNLRFEFVNKASLNVIWDADLRAETVSWGEGYHTVFGFPMPEKPLEGSSWSNRIHPEDFEKVTKKINDVIQSEKEIWTQEYRFKIASGKYIPVLDRGAIIRNEKGEAVRMIGAMQDISENKRAEERLIAEKQLLRTIIDNIPDLIYVKDTKSNHFINNKANLNFLDIKEETPQTSRGLLDFLDKKKAQEIQKDDHDVIINGKGIFNKEEKIFDRKGNEKWLLTTKVPLIGKNNEVFGLVGVSRDITDKKNAEIINEFIIEITQYLNSGNGFKDSLPKINKKLLALLGAKLIEIWLVSPDKNSLALRSCACSNKKTEEFYKGLPKLENHVLGQGIPGTVWKKKSITQWEEVNGDVSLLKSQAQKAGIESMEGVPLQFQQEFVGVLVLGWGQDQPDISRQKFLYHELGNKLGSLIQRKLIEEELEEIFNTVPDIICMVGLDGYFKKVNQAATQVLGYQEEELLAKPYTHFIHPSDILHSKKQLVKNLNSGDRHYLENRFITKNGKTVWLGWTIKIDLRQNLVFSVGKDITDKKELEQLLENTSKLALIGSWELDFATETIYWSQTTRKIHESPPNFQPTLENSLKFYKPEDRAFVAEAVEKTKNQGISFDFELPIITGKGKEKWVRAIGESDFNDGKCTRLYGSFQDIDEKKRAELDLVEALQEKVNILESISDGFFALDRDCKVTYWNSAAEKILQKSREEMLGKSLWDPYRDAVDTDFFKFYQKALDSNEAQHFEGYYPTLNQWFEVSAYPSEGGLSVFFKNVSQRKEAEEKLRLSNERFTKVAEATNDAIYDWDIKKNKLFWGEGFKKMFGLPSGNIPFEKNIWKRHIHPDDHNGTVDVLDLALGNPNCHKLEKEYRFQRKDGSYTHIVDRGIILRDENGKPYRMLGAMQDITERKEYAYSLEKLNKELEEKAKALAHSNAELEQYAFVASHDLQEPLRMVNGFLGQLEKKYDHLLDETGKKYIKFAIDGGNRMRKIILDLLEFSRVGRNLGKIETVEVESLIKDILHLNQHIIRESGASVSIEEMPTIKVEKIILQQVFQNLIINAIKYQSPGNPPKIRISAKENLDSWHFLVKDNGIGIDPSFHDRIFQIFQRLHARNEYSGTGIGLAICKKIIEKKGGEIWVDSGQGQGSVFHFTIPKYS